MTALASGVSRRGRASFVGLLVIAAAIITTGTVSAAGGAFSAASSYPTVRISNTGSGGALDATSRSGNAISAHSNAYGIFGVTNSAAAAGVRGESRSSVAGPGVLGVGQYAVVGDTRGVSGDGSYGLVSRQDALIGGHLVSVNGDLAGYCTIPAGATSAACHFSRPFSGSTFPLVTLTATSDPGGWYWAADTTRAGFTAVRHQTGGALTFVYHVVGMFAAGQ